MLCISHQATLTEEDGQLVERQQAKIGELTIRRALVDGKLKTVSSPSVSLSAYKGPQ